jgi:hypothetical protein
MEPLKFRKFFDFADTPRNWSLKKIALDWWGRPLLLMEEGKPPQPDFYTDAEAWSRWCRIPPKAHHLVHWDEGIAQTLQFAQSQGLVTSHIQRFGDGWLLGEARGGQTTLYDKHGQVRATLDLGDASQDLQTTPDGKIWVSYFDEGVFGNGIGKQGVICFDGTGAPIFKYGDYADEHGLPMVCDCYAMNVEPTGAVWLNYYTDFPLVMLRDFALERIWPSFHPMGNAFAIRGAQVLYLRNGQLMISNLEPSPEPRSILVEDEQGHQIVATSGVKLRAAARGSSLVLNTGVALYELL